MRPPTATRCTPQLFMGLAVLVTGVVFLLYNLGVADLRPFLGYWPWLLVLVGSHQTGACPVGSVRAHRRVLDRAGGLAETAAVRCGSVGPAHLLAGDLIFLGLVIVWHTFQRRPGRPRGDVDMRSWVSATAVLSGVSRSVASAEFAGGELTAFMGGIQLDLTRATIKGPRRTSRCSPCGAASS